jgi:ABC-type multidrug transport system fused ATPase/permease subunit
MTEPLLTFIQALPPLYQSLSCFDRIEEYCVQAPFDTPAERSLTELDIEMSSTPALPPDSVLEFQDASFSWSQEAAPILHDITISLRKGKITAIIGPVGSGKSTLLESAIGETIRKRGSMTPFQSTVAYCPQTPWIINDTIRQNIMGAATYDPKWYNFVIWACALENDFQNIPGGDMSKAGSSGITLSGGQKQRIVREVDLPTSYFANEIAVSCSGGLLTSSDFNPG